MLPDLRFLPAVSHRLPGISRAVSLLEDPLYDDEMTTADLFTVEELAEMDRADEYRLDTADEARWAAEDEARGEE